MAVKKGKLLRDLKDMESDSDKEEESPFKRNTGKVEKGKKTGNTKSRGSVKERGSSTAVGGKLGSSSLRMPKHVLHEVQNSPMMVTPVSSSKSTGSRLTASSKNSKNPKSPVQSLFKKTLIKTLTMDVEQHDESIFDFVASSPEETVNSRRRKTASKSTNPRASAARSKLSLKSRRAGKGQNTGKEDDVEIVRRQQAGERAGATDIFDFDECSECENKEEIVDCDEQHNAAQKKRNSITKSKETKTKEKKPAKTKAKTSRSAGGGRLTRATTAVTEETRTRDRYVTG